jgi:hypothetical protein
LLLPFFSSVSSIFAPFFTNTDGLISIKSEVFN